MIPSEREIRPHPTRRAARLYSDVYAAPEEKREPPGKTGGVGIGRGKIAERLEARVRGEELIGVGDAEADHARSPVDALQGRGKVLCRSRTVEPCSGARTNREGIGTEEQNARTAVDVTVGECDAAESRDDVSGARIDSEYHGAPESIVSL